MRHPGGAAVLGPTVVLCALVAAAAAPGQSVHDARAEAIRLYDAGRYAEALPYLDQVLARKPRDIELLNKRGCVHIRMNHPALAIEDLTKATNDVGFLSQDAASFARQFAPDVLTAPTGRAMSGPHLYESAYSNRGVARLMLGQDEAALADFRRAIELGRMYRMPTPAWRAGMAAAHCGVGQVHLFHGDAEGAFAAFNEAIEYNPDDPNGFIGRGRAAGALRRHDAALADFDAALRLDPDNTRALGYRAAELGHVGRTLEAVGTLDQAVAGEPNATAARRLKAAYLARLGRTAEAVGELDEALRRDPKDAGTLKDRGALLARRGEHGRALSDLDAAIALDPNSAKAYQNRAGLLNSLGRHAEAVRDADSALRLDPRNAGALNNRGLARIGLTEYEAAVADLTAALELDPDLAAAYLNRGGALRVLGRHEDAAADYAAAVRLDPRLAQTFSDPSAVDGLVQVKPRPARDDLAVRHAPSPAVEINERGNIRRASGDWSGAVEEYTRALAADPRSADALALRGWARLCASETGADADARAWFTRSTWRHPLAPSVALMGVLAARRDGRDEAASVFLDEALANLRPDVWPAPVFRYLKGQSSIEDLLAAAGPGGKTLAHAVIGFDLRLRGYRDAAIGHLEQARDDQADRTIARDLAIATLGQFAARPR